MSASTSGVQASNQTMVTFLTQLDPSSPPVTEQRVFDFEITREAQAYYLQQMSIIQYALLDGRSWTPEGGVGEALTAEEVFEKVREALVALNIWSRYKYVDEHGAQQENPLACPFTTLSTMSRYMAQGLDTLIRTMGAAGLNPLGATQPPAGWEDLLTTIRNDDLSPTPIYNLRSVLSTAMAAAANAVIAGDYSTQSQSIQQLLMVDYVASGNEILYGQMNELQTAVNLNQQILSYLNALQDLMNQKDPEHFLMNLQHLNSTSPNYAVFEKQTFGDQVLGTTPKFTDEQLFKYITLLQIQNQGLDPNDILVKAQYGFITTDEQRFELFRALTDSSQGPPILDPSAATIPDEIISKYRLTLYDQHLYANFAKLLVSGHANDSPLELNFYMFKYGLTDFYTAMQTYLDAGTDIPTLPTDPPVNDPLYKWFTATQPYEGNALWALKLFGLCRTDGDPVEQKASLELIGDQYYAFYCGMHEAIGAMAGLPSSDTRTKAMLAMCLNRDIMSQLATYYDDYPSRYPGLAEIKHISAVFQQMEAAGVNLAVTADNYANLISALQQYGLVSKPDTMTPLLGANSVEVLLNLQSAGLLSKTDPTIPAAVASTYGLTAQDQADYIRILEIQADGKDPTDSAVQSEYGLVVRNADYRTVTTAGTAPQAFIDVISGQFNGTGGIAQIIENLQTLIEKAQQYVDPQVGSSVVTELQRVLLDFQGAGKIETWVQNFQNQNEAKYQTHLNNAITAAQALNDTQRQQLQQVMFVYQQFYQSATSMLNALNQLLQTIASNINAR